MEINNLKDAFKEAQKVGFLSTLDEKLTYAYHLLKAAEWGRKKDKENKEYFRKNHLADKYNV